MSGFKNAVLLAALGLVVVTGTHGAAAQEVEHIGVLVCKKCHENQARSWAKTPHAKAFDALRPGQRTEAKVKAGLDPDKEYRTDADCIGCHTTGFGEPGGYDPAAPNKILARVGCESCHGPGSAYRETHGEAERVMMAEAQSTERSVLVTAGQNFDFENACARCHLNYQGSSWKGAKAPFSPFTPQLDKKYTFDFETAIRGDGNHTHYKLYGIFTGPPVPSFHDELQSAADEIE